MIVWKNIVEPDRPQVITWPISVTCWIPKAPNSLSEYVILLDFPLHQWLHKHASMLRYTYVVCLFGTETLAKQIVMTEKSLRNF
jgi:hypothetical protein